jgi:hypothetical protein
VNGDPAIKSQAAQSFLTACRQSWHRHNTGWSTTGPRAGPVASHVLEVFWWLAIDATTSAAASEQALLLVTAVAASHGFACCSVASVPVALVATARTTWCASRVSRVSDRGGCA